MENKNNEAKKLLLTLLVGGAVGAGIVYCVRSAHDYNVPVMKKIGQTISEIGDAVSSCRLNKAQDVVKNIEEKAPSALDVVSNLTDWIDTGLTLWKKFKKG